MNWSLKVLCFIVAGREQLFWFTMLRWLLFFFFCSCNGRCTRHPDEDTRKEREFHRLFLIDSMQLWKWAAVLTETTPYSNNTGINVGRRTLFLPLCCLKCHLLSVRYHWNGLYTFLHFPFQRASSTCIHLSSLLQQLSRTNGRSISSSRTNNRPSLARSRFLARTRTSHALTEQWRTLHPIAKSPCEDGAVRCKNGA